MGDPYLSEQLVEALRPTLGPVTIDGLVRLTGGASRETWSFDALTSESATSEPLTFGAATPGPAPAVTRTPLILQRVRGGAADYGPSFATEERLLAAAARAGAPVPDVVVDSAGCAALGDARITRRIDGESLGPRIVRSDDVSAARAALPRQLAEALAAIHSIPTDEVDGLEAVDAVRQIRDGIDLLGVVSPAFELALAWLERNRPVDPRSGVVHGDFRVGNFVVDHTGLRAVLDWELAHVGDPVEDLGWLCVRAWRFGGDGVVGGFGDVEELLDAYGAATGDEVSQDHLRWWIIAGTLRWGLICAVQARRHLDGHVRSVELATVGRRIAENEHDLLDLLDVAPHDPDSPLPVVDHGRPTAAELLAAVRDHLTEDVMASLPRSDAFGVKVAANALGIVERELAASPPVPLGFDDVAVAARIRDGAELSDAELAEVRAAVTARLSVSNPRWLADTP